METPSCKSKAPFIKLEDNGKASILNYNLPHQTTYNAVSYVGLNIDKKFFKKEELEAKSKYWESIEMLRQISPNGIKEAISTDNKIIKNYDLLKRNIALKTTELKVASKTTLLNRIQNLKNNNEDSVNLQAVRTDGSKLFEIKNVINTSDVNIQQEVKNEFVDQDLISQKLTQGFMPMVIERLSKKPDILFIPKPKEANPTISIVLHLKMASFLGDYGAGQTIKTFSLLPGEKTTITVRTYQHDETKKSQSENILDSFSESSADDLQDTVQKETEFTTGSTQEVTASKTGEWNAGGSVGLNLGFISVGGGGGSSTSGSTFNSSVQNQVKDLVSSVNHHVSKADSSRQIDVNTESSSTSISETEETIVRELENINKSRVLNFVFRQLLQEYLSVTYLDDVSFVYYNGYPESKRTVKLDQLQGLLSDVLINDEAVGNIQNQIYTYLCNIFDYEGNSTSFIEKVEEKLSNCINPKSPAITDSYIRKRKDLKQTYRDKTVNGIILDVTDRIMRTPSLVVDALLGQGEALDCYNQELQLEAVNTAKLENQRAEISNKNDEVNVGITDDQWKVEKERIKKALELIENIPDPIERAKLYKKVFSDCCDVPQSGFDCGCNENPNE